MGRESLCEIAYEIRHVVGNCKFVGMEHGAAMETEMAEVAGLKIGDSEFPAHTFALLDFQKFFPSDECPVVAIIGASTLSARKFSINHKDGYLKIEDYTV